MAAGRLSQCTASGDIQKCQNTRRGFRALAIGDEKGREVEGEGRTRTAGRAVRLISTALVVVCLFASIVPRAEELPSDLSLKQFQASAIVDSLRAELAIDQDVEVELVDYHPFVFSVEPLDTDRRTFRLSMEIGFAFLLSDGELRAALAHELGHVWIFTHHPFLQTERLANEIGQRVVSREDMETVYRKLWHYEGTPGVPIDTLLGSPR